jgi:hypothetical protein
MQAAQCNKLASRSLIQCNGPFLHGMLDGIKQVTILSRKLNCVCVSCHPMTCSA